MRTKTLDNGDKLYFLDRGNEIHASLKNIDNITGVGRTDKEAAADLANEFRLYAAQVEKG